jgi:hypothetical protein
MVYIPLQWLGLLWPTRQNHVLRHGRHHDSPHMSYKASCDIGPTSHPAPLCRHCWARLDAWGRVQIAGQVPQRLVPSWKTTDPLPAAVAAVKTVVPLWAWLVVAAGILILIILGVACWLCIWLRRKRQQEAAAAEAAAMGNHPPGWVVAEPMLPGEEHHKRESGRSKNHRHRPASSPDPREQGSSGCGKAGRSNSVVSSRYASINGWWEGGNTATVPSTPLTPSSQTAGRSPRTPPRTGGAGHERQQRGPARLPDEETWGQGHRGDWPGSPRHGSHHAGSGHNGRSPRDHHRGRHEEADWVHGHIPSLPDGPGLS